MPFLPGGPSHGGSHEVLLLALGQVASFGRTLDARHQWISIDSDARLLSLRACPHQQPSQAINRLARRSSSQGVAVSRDTLT